MDIPYSTVLRPVYLNPTQFSEPNPTISFNSGTATDPQYMIAQIATDQNGDIVTLQDWDSNSTYVRGWLEDTVITDIHTGLP